jgi:hypothetical protein
VGFQETISIPLFLMIQYKLPSKVAVGSVTGKQLGVIASGGGRPG